MACFKNGKRDARYRDPIMGFLLLPELDDQLQESLYFQDEAILAGTQIEAPPAFQRHAKSHSKDPFEGLELTLTSSLTYLSHLLPHSLTLRLSRSVTLFISYFSLPLCPLPSL